MASTLLSNAGTNSERTHESLRKKKKKSPSMRDQSRNPNNPQSPIQWKSETQQQIYSSKLIQALRQVRVSSPPPRRPGRAVREAADRVLAATAKGRSRWSRAILTNRLKIKFMKNRRQRVAAAGNGRWRKPRVSVWRLKSKNMPAVKRKAKLLGRLVPGCRREGLPVVLEEASDYIAALEMQVRAMSALADLLSGAGTSNSNASTGQLVSDQ